jgi:signal transduction histidine kinase
MPTLAASKPPPTVAAAAPAAPVHRGFGREFRRVFNLRTVALVFYVCLAIVVANWFPLAMVDDTGRWFNQGVINLRQTLISGLLVLAAVAAVRAGLARTATGAVPRRAFALGIAVVAVAALISAGMRLWVFGASIDETRWPWFVAVGLLWTLVGGLAYALVVFSQEDEAARAALVEQACAREALNAQVTQAHLSALQAQIEPHFLFNTLANVKRLYETAPGRGREMLSSLIGYLQAALPGMRRAGSTLAQELELARAYLTILQMRMGERLQFSVEAPMELLTAEMPPLVLGTLLENAIKHGIGALPEGGRIDVRAVREGDGRLRLEVCDTGAGFAGEAGSGVGLANTRSRLAALYGDAAQLSLRMNSPRGVVASVVLPLRPVAATDAAAWEQKEQTA